MGNSNPGKSMVKLIYCSQVHNPDNRSSQEMLDLMKEICEKAAVLKITGLLAFDIDSFKVIQVLEGERDKVMKLFLSISKDKRHKVSQVVLAEITRRYYKNWGMKYAGSESFKVLKKVLPAAEYNGEVSTYDKVSQQKEIKEMRTVLKNAAVSAAAE